MVYRVFVEKKPGLAPEAAGLLSDCRSFLGIKKMENVRILNHSLGVFRHFAVQNGGALIIGRNDGVHGADTDAAAAAQTLVLIDHHFLSVSGGRVVGAGLLTGAAANATGSVHHRLAGGVHFHLAGSGAAAHADIFDGSAKACAFVGFAVGQGNENIRIHNRTTDLCVGHIFPVYGNVHIVRAL